MIDRISIRDLCRQLKISSRTLRYYEEMGLIKSVRAENGVEREFTKEQVQQIEDILFLRSYDFPLNEISAFLEGSEPLGSILQRHTEELKSECDQIEGQMKEMERAITMLDERHSIYECLKEKEEEAKRQEQLATNCLIHLKEGDFSWVCKQISSKACYILTQDVIAKIWNGLVKKYGEFDCMIEVRQADGVVWIHYRTVRQETEAKIGFGIHGMYIVSVYADGFGIGLDV